MAKFSNKNKFFRRRSFVGNNPAFTLIEALVFLFIFSIITVSFYRSWVVGTGAILDSKKKAGAVALANERMEAIRNMSYDTVGTVGGDVSGDILAEESVSRSGMDYVIHTDVDAIDDAFDNASGDSNPIDYKKVRVEVSWNESSGSRSAELVSTFVPPGIEDVFTGGILKLKVIDNDGDPVPSIWVRIQNSESSPVLDAYEQTDLAGEIWLYQSTPSQETYRITVAPDEKPNAGYFKVITYARTATFDPEDIHGSVIGGVINSKTIRTDLISNINLEAKDPLGNSIPNIVFDLEGGKRMGYDSTVPGYTYYFDQSNLDVGGDGVYSFSGMSYGSYFFTFKNSPASYKFLWVDPSVSSSENFDVSPNTTAEIDAIFADQNISSILARVVDESDSTPIENAEVQVTDGGAVDLTVSTNKYGYAYFPASGTLPDGTYTVIARKDGDEDSETAGVSGELAELTLSL